VCEGVRRAVVDMDRDGDGLIDREELEAFLHDKQSAAPHNATLLSNLINTLDRNHDGKISAEELALLAH
jgi:Ca2+-binding EF-hand superfamily protein